MTSTDIGISCEFKMGSGASRPYTYLSTTPYENGSLVVVPSRGQFRIVRVCETIDPFVPTPGIDYKRVVCAASGFPFHANLVGKVAYYGKLLRQGPTKDTILFQSSEPLQRDQRVLFTSVGTGIGKVVMCEEGCVPPEYTAIIRKNLDK